VTGLPPIFNHQGLDQIQRINIGQV
jgi:hypothetical protein